MKRIIFGGTFDPIHLGHEKILKSAMQHVGTENCIIVPNLKTTYKEAQATHEQRLRMVEIVANKNNWLVDKFELNNKGENSYTINLVRYLKSLYPADELYLLIGSDQLNNFDQWYHYDEILQYVTLIVYPRTAYDKALLAKYNAFVIEGNIIDISSTNIRNNFEMNHVDKDVAHYIIMNGIYHEGLLKNYLDDKRYLHSMRVAQTAKTIAAKLNPEKTSMAWVAGLYHDLCKCFNQKQLESIAYEYIGLDKDHWKVLHGPVAAYYLEKVYGFNNYEILNAITRHTKPYSFGEPITFLDKLIYCADKLEPNRTDEDVNNIAYFRELLKNDVDKCFSELYQSVQKQYND